MSTEEVLPIAPDEAELRAWDWQRELRTQRVDDPSKTILWLARQTGRNYQQVYRVARGEQTADLEFLRQVAVILGRVAA